MATHREELLQQIAVKTDMLSERYSESRRRAQLVDDLKKENEILCQQYETLKTAKTLTLGQGDVHQARVQLTRLIRQIDSCVSLLMVEK